MTDEQITRFADMLLSHFNNAMDEAAQRMFPALMGTTGGYHSQMQSWPKNLDEQDGDGAETNISHTDLTKWLVDNQPQSKQELAERILRQFVVIRR